MRIVAALVVLFVILLIVWTLIRMVQSASAQRRDKRERWHISPTTDEDTMQREIWLVCKGEDSFLYAAIPWGRSSDEWDKAMLEAEVQVNELNRQRRERLAR